MLLKNLLLTITSFGLTYSRTVKFNVISFGSKVKVNVNGSTYDLAPESSTEPYFTGSVDVPDGDDITYNYIEDNIKEKFTRSLSSDVTSTYNDFYGRKDTIKALGTFQYPDNHWDRSIGKTEVFDDSYIPTVHVTGDKVDSFFVKASSSTFDHITFYFKNTTRTFDNISVSAKNKSFSKFQFKLSLGSKNAKNFYGRYLLKFRNGGEDPLNLRQTIYGNMIQAIGIPSIHSIMVRVYYNKKPAGFYTLQEEATSESFIKSEFYGNPDTQEINTPDELGYIIDGTCGADFEYMPRNISYYDPFDVQTGDNSRLIKLCKALSELDTENDEEVQQFDKNWFDIDTFHKAMAVEYLTGDWDGYWYKTSNFAMYDDPNESTSKTFKHYFITQDRKSVV